MRKFLFRHLVNHSRGQQLRSLKIYCGPQTSRWNTSTDYHAMNSIFHATRSTGEGQEWEISVHHFRTGKLQGGTTFDHPHSYGKTGHESVDLPIDYLNDMPPAILSSLILALGGQADKVSPEFPNLGYDIRTGGLTSKLETYEANWKASNRILPPLESQLQKRKEQGWELWEMRLMQDEAGKEGFFYDRLQASEEDGKNDGED